MLFKDITILDQDLKVREHQYVGVDKERIAYVGDWAPEKDFGRQYSGQGKLLMSGFYNCPCPYADDSFAGVRRKSFLTGLAESTDFSF